MSNSLFLSFRSLDHALSIAQNPHSIERALDLRWTDGRVVADTSASESMTKTSIDGAVVEIRYDDVLHTKLSSPSDSIELIRQNNGWSITQTALIEIVGDSNTRFSVLLPHKDHKPLL